MDIELSNNAKKKVLPVKGVLCTQVLHWIHRATQFFWCFDKTPSANSCPVPPTSWNLVSYKRVKGLLQVEGDTQALQFLYTTAQGFFLHRCSAPFHVIFLSVCVSERKIFHIRTGHICSGRNLREDARCLFTTSPALAKHSSHSLAGMCGLQGRSGVC